MPLLFDAVVIDFRHYAAMPSLLFFFSLIIIIMIYLATK